MNIVLLKSVFPLKKKITLSKKLGIELDNPKTKDEIEYVRNFLKARIDFQKTKKLENYFLMSDTKALLHQKYLEKTLNNLGTQHEKNLFFDKNFLRRSKSGNYYDCLVKSWLIIRFDDEGFFKDLRKSAQEARKKYPRSFVMLEGKEVGPQREERTLKYLSILDLLFVDKFKGSLQKTIILSDDKPKFHLWLFTYLTGMMHGRTIHKEFDYFTIADNLNQIIELSKQIEKLPDEQTEKILYVGESIKSINEHHLESRMMFVMLIGTLEFILTHNPDAYRFNVEDSIRKQFQLKVGIIVNKHTGEDLSSLSTKLKNVYDFRSAIAHGDFISLKSMVSKRGKRKDFDIFDLVEEVFDYVSIVVRSYCREPNFVESLKKL